MTWHQGRMVAFDCETTGVDVESARIVTAAIAFVGGDRPTETRTWLINPGVPIPDEAAAVHGVTTERAVAEGADPSVSIAEIVSVLTVAVDAMPLVAMNARFDLTILDRESRRHGVRTVLGDNPKLRVVDPFVIDKAVDRFRRGSRKLDALCAHYGATLDDAHDAAADAIAAARVAWRQARKTEVGGYSLDALHDAQIGWAAGQAASLAEYFAGRGNAQHVEGRWPIVPVTA